MSLYSVSMTFTSKGWVDGSVTGARPSPGDPYNIQLPCPKVAPWRTREKQKHQLFINHIHTRVHVCRVPLTEHTKPRNRWSLENERLRGEDRVVQYGARTLQLHFQFSSCTDHTPSDSRDTRSLRRFLHCGKFYRTELGERLQGSPLTFQILCYAHV